MTSTPVVRTDPALIEANLKEAVADALLNIVHARVSGNGEFGRILYGARPRNLLNSSFLLPMRGTEEGDEVTSPIWISSHGMDLQIDKNTQGTIRVQPYFALYVRILPNEEDLKREDCRLIFRLNRETARRLKANLKEALDKKWEEVKDGYQNRSKHPGWLTIRDEVREKVYAREGVPANLADIDFDVNEPAPEQETNESDVSKGVAVSAAGGVRWKDEQFEPLEIPHKWLRLDLTLPALEFSPYADRQILASNFFAHEKALEDTITAQLSAWLTSEDSETGGKQWAFRRREVVRPSQYHNWVKFLYDTRQGNNPPVLPEIKPRWDIDISPDWLDPSRLNVHIALENRSEELRTQESDPCIFQVSLRIELPKSMHRELRLERVEPSYRYNRYLNYSAIGFNGGITRRDCAPGMVAIQTTWAPRYLQPRILPTSYDGVERNIRKLSNSVAFDGLKSIITHFRQWLAELPNMIDVAAGLDKTDKSAVDRETQQFKLDLKKWAAEADAIETGLLILEESKKYWSGRGRQSDERAIPFEAWLAMNEAMANLMAERLKNDSGEWRLFQLAFILANLPAIVTRLEQFKRYYREERDDAVTLLYFATGGGKSEAFFGLLIFTLFFDRLRCKKVGVSAMIRYPLRLLTIQQAQRASRALAKAELVRRHHNYGGAPFAIGFWVGSGGSPNRHSSRGMADVPTIEQKSATPADEKTLRANDLRYEATLRAWRKIPKCPFCGSDTALRRFPKEGDTLAHVCSRIACEWNEGTYRPLPFYICDEDIYDFAPSVILGTVDKLALIGHYPTTIRRVFGMLGAAPWRRKSDGRLHVPSSRELRNPATLTEYDKVAPAYPDGVQVFKDPFPALLIQDEAHLLDESLGTFAGLFESALDTVFNELAKSLNNTIVKDLHGNRRRTKVIAASATVSEPERQLEHLYQRHSPAIQFPHPGPELYKSFYAHPQEPATNETNRLTIVNTEIRCHQARIYTAYMTNGRPHTATSVAILSSFHLTITQLFNWLTTGDDASIDRAREMLRQNLSEGLLHNFHDEYLRKSSPGELATLIDLHRIALTYVTNKKGGDQIMAAESEETRKKHVYNNTPFDQLDTRLITGSVEQGEIQKVVELAQTRVEPGQIFRPLNTVMRSVIATSAISHGVDVDEFNSMFFAGMPSDIAEYIQASSRVGRTHIGLCVLIPTPQRRRDRYIVEVFDVFHRFLERMVQPAAIDRWAEKAIERALLSLFQIYVCGVIPSRKLIEKPESKKIDVKDNEAISEVLQIYHHNQKAFVDSILNFIGEAIGLNGGYQPEGAPYYVARIETRIRDFLKRVGEQDYKTSPLSAFFNNQSDPMWRPMMSLRDVDEAALIRVAVRFPGRKRLEPGAVKTVMGLVRHGVAESGDDPEDGA